MIHAEDVWIKHSLNCSMKHIYEELPEEVDSVSEMFSKGLFYGRVRLNSFGFRWDDEVVDIRKNHTIVGLGTSVDFKSGSLHGVSIGASLHGTQALGSLSQDEVGLYKSGKGTVNQETVSRSGRYSMATLAEGYLAYEYQDHHLKIGRQVFESFLTSSNDTKMIPNTFEGLSFSSRLFPSTLLDIGYFTKQKLRDHVNFHHVLGYKSNENDDSAMHTGLTTLALKNKSIKDRLLILSLQNKSIENLTLQFNYTSVPELISSFMLQVAYRVEAGDWSVLPAVRYMKQLDEGAGAIGGANLHALTSGYTNSESLESALYAARIDIVNDAVKWRFGYSQIADKGDILSPWRGFPTGGFTRAMGQYNWYANTKSYMIQLDYGFESVPSLKILSRFVVQNFDDKKIGVQADSKLFSFDILKKFEDKNFYIKTRYAHIEGDDDTFSLSGEQKLNTSYDELRIEMNYLF